MKREGFTLIEVILSMAIIGIIVVSTLTMLNTGLINIKRAGDRTTAVEKAETMLIEKNDANEVNFSISLISSDSTVIMSSSEVKVNKIQGVGSIDGNIGSNVELEIYESFK